jgi:hypothetical protein
MIGELGTDHDRDSTLIEFQGRSPKLSAEKGLLPWEPVASEIQAYLSGSREWWLDNLALA